MRSRAKGMLLATTILVVANVPAVAHAQENEGAEQAEGNNVIIVTARKREETLLDAPLAVSVFGEEALEAAGFTDITEITKAVPGAFVEPINDLAARVNTTPRFRGVTVLSGNRLQQTATVFLDGVYLSGGISTLGINELERVEIIKGPQSALFGRNTFAGAINYVTKDPGNEFRADFSAEAATRNEYRFDGGIEGPIMNGVNFRVSGSYDTKDGQYDNSAVDDQRLGDQSQWSVAGTLLIEPSDSFRLKLRGSYQEIDDGAPAFVGTAGTAAHNFGGFLLNADGTVDLSDSVQPAPRDGSRTESVFRGRIGRPTNAEIGLTTNQASIDAFRGFADDARSDPSDAVFGFKYNPFTVDSFGLNLDSLRLSAAGGFDLSDTIEFSFLAGYNEENFGFFSDFDNRPESSFFSFITRETQDLSVEGRLSGSFLDDSLNVSVGGSYVEIDLADISGTVNLFGPTIFFSDIFRSDAFLTGAQTWGVFGTVDWQLTDTLSITLEGRYQEDRIRDEDVNAGLPSPVSPAKIDSFLPRATLRYQPSDYSTFYFTYAEGNLPGGFNPQVASLDDAQLAELNALAPGTGVTFGEESLTNYEFGWKQQHPDGIFAFNLAAFYMRRSNEIFRSIEVVTETDPNSPNETRTVAFTDNGATTDILGIEFDATVNVSNNFSVQGSFAYIDATIDSFPADGGTGDFGDVFGPAADIAGQQAPRFPPITLSLSSTYEDDFDAIPGFDSWYLRGDLFFTGDFFISNANVARISDATEVNARLGFKGDDVGVEFYVTNLFEEDAPTSGFNFADVGLATRTLPGGFFDFSREGAVVALRDKRQFGIRLNYTFR